MGQEMHMIFFKFLEFPFFSLPNYIPVNGLRYHGEGCCWQYFFNKSRIF